MRIVLAAAALLASIGAGAQPANIFPKISADRPLRVIVTTAPGSGIDQVTRPIAEALSQRIARPVVVDNRAGGNGVIGAQVAAAAGDDGMTLMSTSNSFVVNGVLKRFAFDVRRTFAPVVQVSSQYYLLLCPVSLPVSTFGDVVEYARKNPGRVSFGSGGIGSVGHLGMELVRTKTRMDLTHVPYKSNALAGLDLAAGRIQLLFSNIAGAQMARSGKAKIVAVTSPKRMAAYPNVATLAESGIPGYELSNTYTIYTSARAPAPAVAALNRELVAILSSPELKERFAADMSEVSPPYKPAELQKLFAAEFDKWDAVVKAAKLDAAALY